MLSLFTLVPFRVVLLEGFRKIHWQQKPEQVEGPKGQISNGKPSSHIQSPLSPAVLFVHLRNLSPQPLCNCEYPPRVVENRDESPDRDRKPARKCHPFHEYLTCQEENVGCRCFDACWSNYDEENRKSRKINNKMTESCCRISIWCWVPITFIMETWLFQWLDTKWAVHLYAGVLVEFVKPNLV